MQSFLQYRRAGRAAQAQITAQQDLETSSPSQDITSNQSQGQSPAQLRRSGEIDTSESEPATEDKTEKDNNCVPPGPDPLLINAVLTRHSARTALGYSLEGVEVRDRRTAEGPGEQVFVVNWDGPDDPLNPRNWSIPRRVGTTLQISFIAAVVGAASSIDATVLPQAAADFHVSEVAESLATGLYLIGMGLGSLIAGPFSETFGRNAVYTVSVAVFMVWIMASGLAPNFAAQIIFRFLAGCSSSTPLVCAGGSISDMYNSLEKTWSFPLFAIAGFGGPMLGAVMGAYIGPSSIVDWRWTEWTMLISSAVLLTVVLLFMPETYGPLLLAWKARHYRRITGDSRFRCEHEIVKATLFTRLQVSMTRPFLMLTEPIIMAMTLYLTVVYIILFTFLVGWPYIFERTYGLDQGLANIIFIAMFLGTQINFISVPVIYRMTVRRAELGSAQFVPEIRLWYAMFGACISIPISLFWLGWTNYAGISIWSAIFAVVMFGYGVTGVFICVYMYIIDSYEVYSASALTFVALVRYVVAGGMTVAGIPFYENMGTHWTLTILACISTVLAPIPYVLYYYGHWIRSKSKYAVEK